MKTIAIFSLPRSGSTWLGQIFNSSPYVIYRFQPNFAYTFPLTLKKDSPFEEINNFNRELINCTDPFVTGKLSISSKKNIEFPKLNPKVLVWKETHFIFLSETLLKNSNTYVIGLIRNPLASISSWLKIPKEFDPTWDIKEEWFYGNKKNEGKESHYFGFNKWKEAVKLFIKLEQMYSDKFLLINYNDVIEDEINYVSRLFKFLDIDLTDQTKDFINNSRSTTNEDPYSVFRKKEIDNKWQKDLPDFIKQEILRDQTFIEMNKRFQWI